jgi:FkbM family methyltransferase
MNTGLKTKAFNALRKILFSNRPAELLLRKLAGGQPAEALISRLVPNHYQYTRPSWRSLQVGKDKIDFDLSELMEWYYYFGFRDPAARTLRGLCDQGDTVLDVGANIGVLLTELAQAVGPRGKVFGFEPAPSRLAKCRQMIKALNLDWVQVSSSALGAGERKASLHIRDSKNLGMTQLSLEADDQNSVQIATLDSFVQAQDLKQLDLIKIDVEGFETQVLQGAQKTLAKFKPVLFIEVDQTNLAHFNSSPQELISLVQAAGDYHLWKDIVGLPLDKNLDGCHFDLIAIPKI